MIGRKSALIILVAAALGTGCGVRRSPPPESPSTGLTPEASVAQTPGPETAPESIAISSTPTEEEALEVVRTLTARKEQGSALVPTATPVLPRGLRPGAPGTLDAPDLGLTVTRDAVGLFSQEDAAAHCDGLSLAGFEDWRLPTIVELDRLATAPSFPSNRHQITALWSSSKHDFSGHFLLGFPEASVTHRSAGVAHAICVRNLEKSPSPRT